MGADPASVDSMPAAIAEELRVPKEGLEGEVAYVKPALRTHMPLSSGLSSFLRRLQKSTIPD